jgi:Antibiotic biosynthesis monooxygenase
MKAKLLGILFSLVLVSISYGSKKTGESTNGTVGLLQTTITDNEMMIVAKLSIKPDKIKAFTEAAKEMIEKSNKEPGCKSYQLYQDPYDNTKFVFVEEYKN